MKNKLRRLIAPLSAAAALGLPFMASAITAGPPVPQAPFTRLSELVGPTGAICVIFQWLFAILIVVAVLFIVLAAFKYLTAAGDPEKVKAANQQIVYAAIAIIIGLLARVIPNLALALIGGGGVVTGTC